MNAPTRLTPQRVIDLVGINRVTKDPNYHAGEKSIRFDEVVLALMGCFRVEKDRRAEHPLGWVAFCPQWGGTLMRVDFNLGTRDDGDLILIVTAMELIRR